MTREFTDSREGFDRSEYEAYMAEYNEYMDAVGDDMSECDNEPEFDGQPDEYTEWQDYMGGDDWDHGQYEDMGDFGYSDEG